jgi:hypothetical protein
MPFYIRVPSLITPVHCITQTEEPFLVDYKNNNYQDEEIGHLGKVSPICLQY